MKKGFKRFLIVCIIMVGVGIVFSGIGFLLGGNENVDFADRLSIGGHNGNSILSDNAIVGTKNVSQFSGINVDANMCDIKLVEGDEYKVEYGYDSKYGEPMVSVSDGILYIRDKFAEEQDFDLRDHVGNRKNMNIYIYIYYPAGIKLGDINIDCNLGDITIEKVTCMDLTVEMDCGDIGIKNVFAANGEISTELGDITAENFETKKLDVETSKGDVNLHGTFAGESQVSSEMGDIKVNTSIPKSEYGYCVKLGLGDLKIDGNGAGGSQIINNEGAKNILNIESEVGDVKINFQ